MADTPVDTTKNTVPITYRKAQMILSLVAGLGYNSLPNQGSIRLLDRTSGVPATRAQSKEWSKSSGGPEVEPVTPETFGDLQECTQIPNTSLDATNFNEKFRVLLLILNVVPEPRSTVFTADSFTNDGGSVLGTEDIKANLEAGFQA